LDNNIFRGKRKRGKEFQRYKMKPERRRERDNKILRRERERESKR